MIIQCSYCQMDTAGNHEQNCPNNIKVVQVPLDTDLAIERITALESQVTRLRELCGEGLRIIKDLGNNNIFSHKAVADLEQRLKDEGVLK